MVGREARILVVYRAQHKDHSLPKGKVDPGETLPETAVREIAEETGLEISLGAPLGTVEYLLPGGREKVVYYWSAEVDDHALQLAKFSPNDEIASIEWLSIAKARKKLSYEHDIEVVNRFAARLKAGRARTFAVIAVRHGKAVPPDSWDGPDSTRPLMQRGTDQSVAIAKGIAAFAPERIVSSTAARCLATVDPLSRLTQLVVKASAGISQDAFESGGASVEEIVAKRIKKQRTVVLCSHGPVLPHIISEVAIRTESTPDASLRRSASLDTGDFTVLHISRKHPKSGLVAVETHSPA
jgi:8-oxo-(d)GTP phosphatase